jgi:hypothetical protein
MGRSAARLHIEICPTFAQNRCAIIGLGCQDLAGERCSKLAAELLTLSAARSIERSHLELREVHPEAAAPVVKVFIGSTGLSMTMTGSTSWVLSSIFSTSTNDRGIACRQCAPRRAHNLFV